MSTSSSLLANLSRCKRVSKSSLVYLVLGAFAFVMVFPFVLMVLGSFKTMGEIQAPVFKLLPEKFVFSNYSVAMQRGNWLRYYFNSILVTGVATSVSLYINSMAGYSLARIRFRGRRFLFALSLAGMMVPAQVTMVPVFIMLSRFPLAGGNSILGRGGSGLINTYWGLIIPYVAGSFGVFLCRQFYLSFPAALDDAARIDGYSRFGTFNRIYMPLSRPLFMTLGTIKAVYCWNEYLWPLIITNSEKMWTIQLALATFKGQYTVEWNLMLAMTVISVLPLIVVFLYGQRYYIQGLVTSGVKG